MWKQTIVYSENEKKAYIRNGLLHLRDRKKKTQTDCLIPPWLISTGLTASGSLFGKVKRRKRYEKKEEL